MKSLARSFVYWPGLDQQIENLVRKCHRCNLVAKSPRKAQNISWPTPSGPWNRVHIDYAGPYEGQNFLILVDAFSKWPEVIPMKSTTASHTVSKLQELFSRFGMPETIVSDNGTQFNSSYFNNFCTQNGIIHINTPVYHASSNGQAERFVDTFKRAYAKLKGEGKSDEILHKFLFNYRMTPNNNIVGNISPAEAIFGRKIRSKFSLLNPLNLNKTHTSDHSSFPKFNVGDLVYIKRYHGVKFDWINGTIQKRKGRVLYEVKTENKLYTRHQDQIRRRYCQADQHLNLEILLDTFNLLNVPESLSPNEPSALVHITEQPDQDIVLPEEIQNAPSQDLEEPDLQIPSTSDPPIRASRNRHPPSRLQLDPTKKTYFSNP